MKVGGKEFAMTIPKADEEKYRRAVVEINELISVYKGSFVAEPEDYLAMAALQVAVDKVSLEMERSVEDDVVQLEMLSEKIDDYLNNIRE